MPRINIKYIKDSKDINISSQSQRKQKSKKG